MNTVLRDKLQAEITRKQFLQYMGIVLLSIFGFNNLLSLFGTHKHLTTYVSQNVKEAERHGFGSSRFGV